MGRFLEEDDELLDEEREEEINEDEDEELLDDEETLEELDCDDRGHVRPRRRKVEDDDADPDSDY